MTGSARGLNVADPSKAPKGAGRSSTAERTAECWALDDWTWQLADRTPVQILDVLDNHSRYAVACTAMASCAGAATFDVFATAASDLGWPQRFWSDNGSAFTGVLAHAVSPLGVTASHTRPTARPATASRTLPQTEHRWLLKQPAAGTIGELQAQLQHPPTYPHREEAPRHA